MKEFTKIMLCGLGLGLFAVVLSSIPSRSAAPPLPPPGGPSVTVANTSANPVPVTGNVAVTNTPGVTIANTVPVTGTVAISSLPALAVGGTVNVTNATDAKGNPVLVTDSDAARNGFFATSTCQFPSGMADCGLALYTVPANQIAVPQTISGFCQFDAGSPSEKLSYVALNIGGGFLAPPNLFVSPSAQIPGLFGLPTQIFRENITGYYLAPGTVINFFALTSQPDSGLGVCQVTLGGYLVHQ